MNRKIIKTVGILAFVVIIGFGIFYYTNIVPANRILEEVRNAEIKAVDLNKVPDGSYVGEFSYNKTRCKVEVVVKSHRIEAINILENGTTKYAKKAEGVTTKIIEQQKTNVDVVSGATTTSKALLKAVEAALSSGL